MTTSNHTQIDLPRIPSLPPIEMPEASSFLKPSDFADKQNGLSPLHTSSSSLASQDTFMTADSSNFSDLNATPTTASPELLSPVSPLSPGPMPALRKSISVDSFIKYRTPSDSATRPARGNTISATTKPTVGRGLHSSHPSADLRTQVASSASSLSEGRKEHARRPFQTIVGPSRSRGASVSTTATGGELDDTFFDESDMERSEDLINVARKGKSRFKRPGDLSLPSRLQSVNSSPTMGKTPPPIVPERSSSLTHKLTKQRSLISVNTHLPSSPHPPSDITIAVLGPNGSGKSTIIRKGLKAYGLSEASSSSTTSIAGGETFRYIYRVGRLSHHYAADCLLRVLEVDILALDSSTETRIFPEGAPPVDGLVFCYDASEAESFDYVRMGLHNVAHLTIPTIVFACKSDLERQVDPNNATRILHQYDVGLIEATAMHEHGKKKIRDGFDWMFKAIIDPKRGTAGRDLDLYRNPASPAVLTAPPLEISRASSATPTGSSVGVSHSPLLPPHLSPSSRLASGSEDLARIPVSPTRTRSMSELLSDRERDWESNGQSASSALSSQSRRSSHTALSGIENLNQSFDDSNERSQSIASRDSRPPRWLTLEELLDKLLFVAVSEDDPTFISHFLLTYRRFAKPRDILLAMQKRMRSLDVPTGDPMFACYAQMKICWLLDHWIHVYPSDFAVAGTEGALSGLIKSVIGKTYLLHYGSVFIPFLETLPKLKDQDTSWAMKVDEAKDDSDDSSSVAEVNVTTPASPVSSQTSQSLHDFNRIPMPALPPTASNSTRERKASLPLSAKMLMSGSSPTQAAHISNSSELTWARKLKNLVALSHQFLSTDPSTTAQEISRVECGYFLEIQPRHWLQHVIGRGEKDPRGDTISRYNHISHHIANWVVSLILCQDKPKIRARAISHFVELASRLRNMNNYSALRAVIAGINSAAFETDATMQIFRSKSATQHKLFQSFDHLLQAVRAHGKYRLALRNSKGACIPALEIHLSDLIRAHEGNSDFHDDDPSHIHWEKWNMMGRFIDGITQCQQACRENGRYDKFPEDSRARELLLINKDIWLMDPDQQNERIQLDKLDNVREDGYHEEYRPTVPRQPSRDTPTHTKEGPLRKIFFW
ncbi:ras guanine nucleotide exchange factor domain-containing protein [Cytidiella melzeri]|nr:ras guanine nucleotide exchange factor domain-containing protein [Cytidiella melzeri]